MSYERHFEAHQPVFCTSKYIFSGDLAKHRALKEFAVQLCYQLAAERKVQIYAYFFLHNHIHMIVSQDHDGHDADRHLGIAFFMRDFERFLSVRMNRIAPLHGGKFTRRYHSVNLITLEHFVNKMGYTLGQALNHGIDPQFTLSSYEVLCADINVLISELPIIYRGTRRQTRREMAQMLADVLNATLANYQALKAGQTLDPDRTYAARGARARKMQAARGRRDRQRAERQARRMRRDVRNYDHWKEAAQVALWQAGIDSEQISKDLPRFRTQPLNPERWAADCRHWETWVCPPIETELTFEPDGRVRATRVHVDGYDDVIIDWLPRLPPRQREALP